MRPFPSNLLRGGSGRPGFHSQPDTGLNHPSKAPVSLGLPRDLNPFSRRTPRELTAREAFDVAEAKRLCWAESDFCNLCCVYAGALEGEDPRIGPLTLEGRGRLWHFDYYAAEAERFLRVQVYDGRARSEETKIRAGGLDYPQMKFPFAAYGYHEDRGREAAPVLLPANWTDTPVILASFLATLSPDQREGIARFNAVRALIMPAAYARRPEKTDWMEAQRRVGGGMETQAGLIVEIPGTGGKLTLRRFDLVTGKAVDGGPAP